MKLKICLFYSVFLLTVVGTVSCSNNESAAADAMAQQAPSVSVDKVKRGDGSFVKTYSAAIEGITNVEVRPQISGYLQKVFTDEGAFVRAGQPLFKIDDRPYLEQYNTAKAAVLVAEANVKNQEIDLNRKKELVKNNIVSELQVTQANVAYESAKASLAQANAAMNAAKINLDFCLIKAPTSGYLGRFPYRLGSLVGPSSVEPLTLLTDISNVYAYFSMSEGDFTTFQNERQTDSSGKDSVSLLLPDGTTYVHKGVIDAIAGQFDKNTGSISIRTKFKNPGAELRSGNTGRIQISTKMENVLLVPIKSTLAVQDKIYTYILDSENKVEQVELEIVGKDSDNYYVTSGVSEGQTVLTGGLGFVSPGMTVNPK